VKYRLHGGPIAALRGRLRPLGLALLGVLALLHAVDAPWVPPLRTAWFDATQRLLPRAFAEQPAIIVDIDDASLAARGQWPWPRTLLADLVRAIAQQGPAVIGIDILMSEPDRLSPGRVLRSMPGIDPALAAALAALPSNDTALARALVAAPTVLIASTAEQPTGRMLSAPPIAVVAVSALALAGGGAPSRPPLQRAGGVITSIDEIDRAARGRGIVAVRPSAIVRRVPLITDIGGTLAPGFAIEMLRVALGAKRLSLLVGADGAEGVVVGDVLVPVEPDAAARIHYSHSYRARYVAAVDVLDGRVDPAAFRDKLVIVGASAAGLNDNQFTPLHESMPGSEIHAQLLENIVGDALLRRPGWAPALEVAAFVALGLVLVLAMPRSRPGRAALVALGLALLPLGASLAAHSGSKLTLDGATPTLHLLLLFGALSVLALTEAARQRRSLEATIREQRERAAFVAGEFAAARRIQTGMLPSAAAFRDDPRIDIAATMVPAREVGGDLYDFFRLDADRVFFLVGDVAGKGLSASLFMAVGKALCKSAALSRPDATASELLTIVNVEVARDNQEMLFVTAFAGIVDLSSGSVDFCSAGHDAPYLLAADCAIPTRLTGPGGPPLCVVDDFAYPGGRHQLAPGDAIVLVSDGVTESRDAAGAFYGAERLAAALRPAATPLSAAMLVEAVRAEVERFAAGADAADDLTVLALVWRGPRAAPQHA
jgi:CHASE2 domain-containing sensor protein/serine phosphatase RsbU (regulator of sigma subunit)